MTDLPESFAELLKDDVDESKLKEVEFPKEKLLKIDGVGDKTAERICEDNPYMYSPEDRKVLVAELGTAKGIGVHKSAKILNHFDLF